jgi:hypothetical protein
MSHDNFEHDDPLELTGVVLPGEAGQLEAMAECIVEEYIRLGWTEQRLMTLFLNPMFLATHRVCRLKGEAYVRNLICRTLARWGGGALRFPSPTAHTRGECSLMDAGQIMDDAKLSPEVGNG